MNGQSLNARVLQDSCDFPDADRPLVPAQSGLYRDGTKGFTNHDLREASHLGEVLQDRGTRVLTHHLLHRTPEVDVDQIGLDPIDDLCRPTDLVLVSAEYLDPEGPLFIAEVEFLPGLFRVVDQASGGDELGVEKIGSQPLADDPKGGIADVLHRRQQQGAASQLDRPDSHNRTRARYGSPQL